MDDPLNDPRFPLRPDHPDFWKLCQVALKYDGRMMEATSEEAKQRVFEEAVEGVVDIGSISYFALQRAIRITNDPRMVAALTAIYIEGFIVGHNYGQVPT